MTRPSLLPGMKLEPGHQWEGTGRRDRTQRTTPSTGETPISQHKLSELAAGGWPLALVNEGSRRKIWLSWWEGLCWRTQTLKGWARH